LRFSEHGKVRFISHRDAARAFERAFRICELPLAFTQGFSPRPKVSFGLALSVGHSSDAEYLDVELVQAVALDALSARLTAALPEGLEVTGAAALADRAPALQEAVTAVEWELDVVDAASGSDPAPGALADRAARALAATELPVVRTRKGREGEDDVRPALRRLAPRSAGRLAVEVSTQPTSIRPNEVVAALGGGLALAAAHRSRQWIERGGTRLEPLDADPRTATASAPGEEGTDVRRDHGGARLRTRTQPDRGASRPAGVL
jgi:radical SAM-linked protein